MLYSVIALAILWTSCPTSGVPHEIVTYEELEKMEAACFSLDNCKMPRKEDRLDRYNCNCGNFCVDYDTCCVDSPHTSIDAASPDERISCARVNHDRTQQIFMIDSCRPGWAGDPSIAELCTADARVENDPMLMIPVTSTRSGRTYKNYFCFACNNDGSEEVPTFWDVKLGSNSNIQQTSPFPELIYNSSVNAWTIENARDGRFAPVAVQLEYGTEIEHLVKRCRTRVVSECPPRWEDDAVRRKCSAYMAIVMFFKGKKKVQYRNPHCALCNGENIEQMECSEFTVQKAGKQPFSFALLLDVNRSDGDVVGQVSKCDSRSVYDPFFKKCRTMKCVLPGFFIKNGKCSRN